MAFCSKCGTEFNDGAQFCPKCGQPTNAASQQQVYQQPAQAYQQPQQRPVQPNSNMVMAILTTLFCCLPTGIYAIIQASKVDKLYFAGEYDEAEKAAGEAKKWSYIGIVLSVIGWIIYFVFFMGLGFLAAVGGA